MSANTHIEWTDATWNPVTGCTKVSAGCKHCYAERDWARLVHMPAFAGRAFTDVACHADRLDQPLRWKKPRRVFVNSMSDLFHDDVPDSFIDQVFAVMAMAPQHTFQVLTKRPRRMRDYLSAGGRAADVFDIVRNSELGYFAGTDKSPPMSWPLQNVWVGVSIEDQNTADVRIPLLLQTPAAVRWVSAEPLLGPVSLMTDLWSAKGEPALDWVVVGGESGPKARPMHPYWPHIIRRQCADSGVPFMFKQWGEWAPASMLPSDKPMAEERWAWVNIDNGNVDKTPFREAKYLKPGHELMGKVGKKTAGRLLEGRLFDAYPEVQP